MDWQTSRRFTIANGFLPSVVELQDGQGGIIDMRLRSKKYKSRDATHRRYGYLYPHRKCLLQCLEP
jgi:hypothetical protein